MNTSLNEETAGAAAGADAATAAAAVATGASGAQGAGEGAATTSAFAVGATAEGGSGTEGAQPTSLAERIPEKLRVVKEDGTLDVEASAAKLVDGYTNLEKRLGTGDTPPKTPEEYAPELPDTINIDELKTDPLYQSFLKGAHGKGLTNAQVSWVLNEYAARAGEMAGPAPMTVEALRAEVEPHLVEMGGFNKGIELGIRAVKTFIPGVTAEEIATLPNHPLVVRLLAAVGKEVGEDTQIIHGGGISPSDFDSEAAAIKASDAYNQANHPEHKAAVDKLSALYERRYGKQPVKLGASAVVKAG